MYGRTAVQTALPLKNPAGACQLPARARQLPASLDTARALADNAGMSSAPDAKWPRLLSLSAHEFRTPLSVVAGYIRMLLTDRAGAVTDQQRRLLEEAEKSCGRISALVAELSDLGHIEAGTAPFKKADVDLKSVLADAIAGLPPVPDREIAVSLTSDGGTATVAGDTARLKTAFASVLYALRREIVGGTELQVQHRVGELDGKPASWVVVGNPDQIAGAGRDPGTLAPFDEFRGGCGLSLAVARRVFDAHGGTLWAPKEGMKAGAVIVLPHAPA